MPDENRQTLGIDIEVAKKGAGGQAAAQEVRDATSATGKLTDATKETGKATEELSGKTREWRRLLAGLGHETVPELGEALEGIKFGGLESFFIILAGVSLVTKAVEEQDEAIKKLNDEMASLKTSIWQEQSKSANEAAEAAQDYADKLADIGKQTDALKQKEQLEVAVLNARAEAQQKILAAQEKAELASAGGDKAREEEIRNRYEGAKSAADLAAESQRISEMATQKTNREIAARDLKAKADAAEAAKEAAINDSEAAAKAAELEEAKNKQGDLNKAAQPFDINALRKQLETASTDTSFGMSEAEQIERQIANIQSGSDPEASKALKAQADNQKKVSELNTEVENHKEAVKRATKAAEETSKAFTENADAIKQFTQTIDQQKTIFDIHKQTSQDVKQISAPETPVGKAILNEVGNARSILTGHADAVDDANKTLISELGSMIAGHTVTLKQAAALISKAGVNVENFMSALAAANRTGDEMRTASQLSVQHFEKIYQDIADLNQRLGQLGNQNTQASKSAGYGL